MTKLVKSSLLVQQNQNKKIHKRTLGENSFIILKNDIILIKINCK